MNYRHIYHAGNICDVVKHASLVLLLERLKAKDAAFAVLDTHAGEGLYDLFDPRAAQTNEAAVGARRLWEKREKASPELEPYLSALKSLNEGRDLKLYPGSPVLARRSMRQQDRLVVCELHPEDAQNLKRTMRDEAGVEVHSRDGYEAVKAFLPFKEKRGLVFIDPPFEVAGEIDRLVAAARVVHERMAGAVVAIWYPIKERPAIWRFHEALIAAGLPKLLAAEFLYRPEVRHDRLNGSGLIVMNAPWKIEEDLARLFTALHETLETEARESFIRLLTEL